MSLAIQTTSCTDGPFFETSEAQTDHFENESRGLSPSYTRSSSSLSRKNLSLLPKGQLPSYSEGLSRQVHMSAFTKYLAKPSPFQLAGQTLSSSHVKTAPQTPAKQPESKPRASFENKASSRPPQPQTTQKSSQKTPPPPALSKQLAKTPEKRQSTRGEKLRHETKEKSPLQARSWSHKETEKWWNARMQERERGDQQRDGEKERRDQPEEQADESFAIKRVGSNKGSGFTGEHAYLEDARPLLAPPRLGVFALYYLLTKIGIASDGAENFAYKQEIELVDRESTIAHKKRLEMMREAIKKEEENSRWSVAMKVYSWLGSLLAMVTGVALIATGVGVVAGAMLIVGGMIQLTSQIMDLTGGWKKITEMLPGEDSEKKRAVVSWMQIGIAVLCLALSGAGVIFGGYSNFGDGMKVAMMAVSAVGSMGQGALTIGDGLTAFMFRDRLAEAKQYELTLAKLKHKRRDLMEQVEWGMDRLGRLFEDLAKALDFEEELFRADQMINRR